MSEDLPPNLRRMLDDLPVGQAPVGDLLAARRTQQERWRRWAVMGTAAATVVIVAGGWVAAQVMGGGTDPEAEAPAAAVVPSASLQPGKLEGSVLDVPTSDWQQGDAGMQALIFGTLGMDRRGCVVLRDGQGSPTPVIWPDGYHALFDIEGRLHLWDAADKPVARDGDELSMGGGYLPAGENRHPCVRGKKEVAWVQDTVTVTKPGADHAMPELPGPTGSPDDRAYQQWLDREPLPDCGSQRFAGLSLPPDRLVFAICLRAAVKEGTGGEAVRLHTTVEGDPITQYLRVLPDGSAELFEDATQDKFGSGRWHRWACGDLDRLLEHRC